MELELGLKFTRVADEFSSDFQLAKDRSGTLFLSRETDAMFILTAHLKGYRRGNIKIDINEDGSLIAIRGERQVKETVMVGWKVIKKDTETKGFKKVYKIPDGVILDRIKAKFNEDESTLTITMPKKTKGIRGTAIEEIKENHDLIREGSGELQIADERREKADEKRETAPEKDGEIMPLEEVFEQVERPVSEHLYTDDDDRKDHDLKDGEKGKDNDEVEEEMIDGEKTSPLMHNEVPHVGTEMPPKEEVSDEANDIHEEGRFVEELPEEAREADPGQGQGEGQEEEHKLRGKRCKMCIPLVAGSTVLLSLVVFVIQIIRSKNQTRRRD